jgi:hypothetical protein
MLNVNDAPVVVAASLTVAEGQTVAVGTANFNVTDSDNTSFTYTVSSVSNGRFQLSSNPGQAITSFSTALLSAGLVQFVHNGGEAAPAYNVQVSDGSLSSNTAAASISFTNVNDAAVVSAGSSIPPIPLAARPSIARRDNPVPRRDAIRITCEKDAETAGKILLYGVVFRITIFRLVTCCFHARGGSQESYSSSSGIAPRPFAAMTS